MCAKISFGILKNGQKDGHFGAHQGGDKRVLTGGMEVGNVEWGREEGEEEHEPEDRFVARA
jgi:hypothetical protein